MQSIVSVRVIELDNGYSLSLMYDGAEHGLYGWYTELEAANRAAQAMFDVIRATLKATLLG